MDYNFSTLQNENLVLFGVEKPVKWTECDVGKNYDGALPKIKKPKVVKF